MNKLRVKQHRRLPIVMHLLAWLVLIILPQIIISRYSGNNNFVDWRFYMNALIIGLVFYINYFWLVPKFYLSNKRLLFFLLTTATVVCFYFILDYSNQIFHNPERDRRIAESVENEVREGRLRRPPFKLMQIYGYTLLSVVVVGFAMGLRAIEQYTASEKRQKELEKEKLNSELAFLKNQVSPHFFFNTLNNIYSMVAINTDDAQAAILKLSKLMRYLLYESEHGETMLSAEVEFMRHYVDLMQLRVSQKVDIQIDLPNNQNDLRIPPLLFIPFIENAFKHGISYRDKSFIKVGMETKEEKVYFCCKNSVAKEKVEKRNENHSGIGLENVKKRLNLLFAGRYDLNIESTPEIFSVKLEINTAK